MMICSLDPWQDIGEATDWAGNHEMTDIHGTIDNRTLVEVTEQDIKTAM
jgi:hypothetical protein